MRDPEGVVLVEVTDGIMLGSGTLLVGLNLEVLSWLKLVFPYFLINTSSGKIPPVMGSLEEGLGLS
jgi:hypothetical protein